MNDINMVPFIDVMLVLLIIFMVTAPLISPSVIDVPSVGKASTVPDRVITIEITRKGRLNLHKFDAKMQAQLEGYLVALGILGADQTLSASGSGRRAAHRCSFESSVRFTFTPHR